jgi:hypothetical protein
MALADPAALIAVSSADLASMTREESRTLIRVQAELLWML